MSSLSWVDKICSKVLSKLLPVSVVQHAGMSYVHRMLISTNNQETLKVCDMMINYEKVGTGSHPILCLPGALGSIDTDFRPQLASLNESEFTIVAWDPPGYGRSRPPVRDFTGGTQMYSRDAQVAEALMKELKLDTFSMLGWSDGGITAMILAAMFPNSVRKLVIWGANAYTNEQDVRMYKSVRNIDNLSPSMKKPLIELYGEEYFRKAWSDCVDCWIGMYEKEGGDICTKELSQINCPTLIIHGKKDPLVGIEHAEYLQKHIKNSRLIVMEDGKHNLHLKHFKKFNRLVEEFLTEE